MSCQETDEGRGLNESLVKWLTGGDVLTGRRMREDGWMFQPTHKLILSTNHKPTVRGQDNGIWRRLRLIPFNRKFEGKTEDRALPERLRAEAPGILAWLVRGCLDWVANGERVPDDVLLATSEYRKGEDIIERFLAECCELGPGKSCRAGKLYDAFKGWSQRTGERRPLSQTAFGTRLTEKGIGTERKNGIIRTGVDLLTGPPLEQWNSWSRFPVEQDTQAHIKDANRKMLPTVPPFQQEGDPSGSIWEEDL